MSDNFLDRPRSWPWLALGAVLVLLLAVAAGLVVKQAMRSEPKEKPTGVPSYQPIAQASPAAEPSPVVTSTGAMLTGDVRLVRGERFVNGVYLGYPHSTIGALSAAVEYMTQIGSTLEPDRSAAVLRLVGDPSYQGAPTEFAEGTRGTRKSLGLAENGAVPPGASVVLSPVQYQVRDVSADQATVLLLANYTTMLPNEGSRTRVGVFPLYMHWADGDWRVLEPHDDDQKYTSLAAVPGSPDASAKGWQVMRR